MNVHVCHIALHLGGIARLPNEVFISSAAEGRCMYIYFLNFFFVEVGGKSGMTYLWQGSPKVKKKPK